MEIDFPAKVRQSIADKISMIYRQWITLALGSLALLAALRLIVATTDVHSGARFENSHSQIACSECHALRAELGGGIPAEPIHRKQCERCHAPEATSPGGIPLDFHSDGARGCGECHSFHDTEEITVGEECFRVSFENSFQRAQCYSCHKPLARLSDLSPGHRAAAVIYHSDFSVLGRLSSSESCLICHSQSAAVSIGELGEHARSAPRFDEHGSHPVSVPVRPGNGQPGNKICADIDNRIQLFGGRIECQSCHSLTSRNKYRLIAFDSKNDLCRACHQLD